jgi:aarF domain-containing kinase
VLCRRHCTARLHQASLLPGPHSDGGAYGTAAAAAAAAQILELVRQHRVSLPGHICAVVVTTLILEGWSNQLDPKHSVLTQVGGGGAWLPWLWPLSQGVEQWRQERRGHRWLDEPAGP